MVEVIGEIFIMGLIVVVMLLIVGLMRNQRNLGDKIDSIKEDTAGSLPEYLREIKNHITGTKEIILNTYSRPDSRPVNVVEEKKKETYAEMPTMEVSEEPIEVVVENE